MILDIRRDLKDHSALGEGGAGAIRRELLGRGLDDPPVIRTIGRVLQRHGVLDGRSRLRRPAPPRGWYLPALADAKTELDSFDLIEDLRIQDGPMVDVLTGISLHGGLAQAWPLASQVTAKTTLQLLLEHWQTHGRPGYAQFDNDTRFQGAHQHCDSISRVMRLCLALEVIPVFAPPRETGFQAAVEQFNRRWQDAVWRRFHHPNLSALRTSRACSSRLTANATLHAWIGRPNARPCPWTFAWTCRPRPRERRYSFAAARPRETLRCLGTFSMLIAIGHIGLCVARLI